MRDFPPHILTSQRQCGEEKLDLLHWDCASYSAAVVGLTGKLVSLQLNMAHRNSDRKGSIFEIFYFITFT